MNRTALAAATLITALTGCQKIPGLGDVMSRIEDYTPTLSFDGFELRELSWEGADVDFKFQLENPNPVSLTLPYSHDGALPVLRAPTISLDGFRLGEVDWGRQTASMELDFRVANEQSAA